MDEGERCSEKRAGGPSVETVPEGDNRTRLVCPDCGYIEYANPKIVAGAVCTWEDRILLCRRAIAPAKGLWTIPAGYLELGETTAAGAAREVMEEAGARVTIGALLGLYEIAEISQVNVVYHAPMLSGAFAAGVESLDVRLFAWEDIPWRELAFPSVRWFLERFREGGAPRVRVAAALKGGDRRGAAGDDGLTAPPYTRAP
jgi:ADP-ribose pyrophosphatase YjhB (NUDIX family)